MNTDTDSRRMGGATTNEHGSSDTDPQTPPKHAIRTEPLAAPVLYNAAWQPLGTLTDGYIATDDDNEWTRPDPDASWILPTRGEFTTEITFTDMKIGVALWMVGGPDNWVTRPRMKRRAYRRRILRVTRAGRRR